MNAGGVALIALGVLVVCQVIAGNAIERLNLLPAGTS